MKIRNAASEQNDESQVNENGNFETKIPKQDAGTILTVTVTNEKGDILSKDLVEVIKLEIDTSALEKLIEQAKVYQEDDYTESVVENAREQLEVTEAFNQLQAAIDGLTEVTQPDPDPEPSPNPETRIQRAR